MATLTAAEAFVADDVARVTMATCRTRPGGRGGCEDAVDDSEGDTVLLTRCDRPEPSCR
jgi:hypothetical protein